MNIPYTIISISPDRNSNIQNIVNSFGYEPEESRCFDISKNIDVNYFRSKYPEFRLGDYLINKKYITNPQRNDGEIGCWMSHYNAWNYALENSYDEFIIIEDDCFITEQTLEEIKNLSAGYDIFMAGNWGEFYFLNRKAILFLIENASNWFTKTPVDEFLFDSVREGYLSGTFQQGLVWQMSYESNIINKQGDFRV